MPGRAARLAETAFRRMGDLIPALADALKPHIVRPFIFFGHSLGAAIAYELILELNRRDLPLPDQLFVSARRAPHLSGRRSMVYALGDEDFVEVLRQLQGTTAAVLNNLELMELLLPMLRADFELSETYLSTCDRIETPIFAFSGSEDVNTSYEEIDAWSKKTEQFGGTMVLKGDHFFLHEQYPRILNAIASRRTLDP